MKKNNNHNNGINNQNNNIDATYLYKQLLTKWSLSKYIETFENEGFENVEIWHELIKDDCEILKNDIKMKKGHILQFSKYYHQMLTQNSCNNTKNISIIENNYLLLVQNDILHVNYCFDVLIKKSSSIYTLACVVSIFYVSVCILALGKSEEINDGQLSLDVNNVDNNNDHDNNNNIIDDETMTTMGKFLCINKQPKNMMSNCIIWSNKKATVTKSFVNFIHPKYLEWSYITDEHDLN